MMTANRTGKKNTIIGTVSFGGRDAAFFESAKAEIREEVMPDLEAVARTLKDLNNDVRIEGHTDAVPIRSSVYRSNWELSAARAAAVLTFFVDTTGLSEERMSVAGYGSQRPLATNDTQEGRSQNRRVDIVVLEPREVGSADRASPGTGSGT